MGELLPEYTFTVKEGTRRNRYTNTYFGQVLGIVATKEQVNRGYIYSKTRGWFPHSYTNPRDNSLVHRQGMMALITSPSTNRSQ